MNKFMTHALKAFRSTSFRMGAGVLFVGVLLAGCRSDVDLNNLDTTMEVSAKVGLPIGTVSAKLSDFLGTSDTAQLYIDTVDNKNVLTMKIAMKPETKSFEGIDFASRIPSSNFFLNIYDRLIGKQIYIEGLGYQDLLQDDGAGGKKIQTPDDDNFLYKDKLTFDMPIPLTGINQISSEQRVDKVQLSSATFDVMINRQNFNDLDWQWIDTIDIVLSQQFTWQGHSNTYTLYKKGDNVNNFGEHLEMAMTNVLLDMIKDHNLKPSFTNVWESMNMQIIVSFHVPGHVDAPIGTQSGIRCDFKTKNIVADALWGWFTPGAGVSTADKINIDLGQVPILQKARLPIAAPKILAHLKTPVAGNLKLTVDSLYTIDGDGLFQHANFNGSRKGVMIFDESTGCINPNTSPMSAVSNVELQFDNTPAHGHIDSLFINMPHQLGYRFNFNFDDETTPSIRIGKDLWVTFDAEATVPLVFNKGAKIDYRDKHNDVNIGKYQIDSLLKDVKVIDSVRINDVWLYLKIENGIPLNIAGSFRCLNANGDTIMDPVEKTKPYMLVPDQDTVHIAGAKYLSGSKTIDPVTTPLAFRVTQEHLNLFPDIKTIIYTLSIDDESLNESEYGVELKGDNNLKIQIGLTADLKAVFDPKKTNK